MSYSASEIIALRDAELSNDAQFRTLWQDTMDYIFPQATRVLSIGSPGERRTTQLFDQTAGLAARDMASGMSSLIIPTGKEFFGFKASNRQLNLIAGNRRWMEMAAEHLHDALFCSNFMLMWGATLKYIGILGTCNLFSDFDIPNMKLNFKNFPIGSYQILEDNNENVDTVMMTLRFTARQAAQEFGEDKLSEKIRKALKEPKQANTKFEFIHYIGPRQDYNPKLRNAGNMPFESCFVDVSAKEKTDEGGYEEFPCAVARWSKNIGEKWGRGEGTEIVEAVKALQQMMKDLIECANRYNNPAREVIGNNLTGQVNNSPGANNFVTEGMSIRALDSGMQGNFPISKEMLEMQRAMVNQAFYHNLFSQFTDLTGDRRTTVEIQARMREALRLTAVPVSHIETELLTPTITRCLNLLVRNGVIEKPPPELSEQFFTVEYLGELGLALRNQQANAFADFAGVAMQLAQVFPAAMDIPNMDRGLRRLAETRGVNVDDINTEEEVAAKQKERQQIQQAQMAMQAIETGAKAYGQGKAAPEEGSPAAEMMGTMK